MRVVNGACRRCVPIGWTSVSQLAYKIIKALWEVGEHTSAETTGKSHVQFCLCALRTGEQPKKKITEKNRKLSPPPQSTEQGQTHSFAPNHRGSQHRSTQEEK